MACRTLVGRGEDPTPSARERRPVSVMKQIVAETRAARSNYDRLFPKQGPPQGLTKEQFQQVSERLRQRLKQEAGRTDDLGDDLFVHGSRALGTAAPDADLDIGIRVSAERFDQLVQLRLVNVKVGGDKWKTLQRAL